MVLLVLVLVTVLAPALLVALLLLPTTSQRVGCADWAASLPVRLRLMIDGMLSIVMLVSP